RSRLLGVLSLALSSSGRRFTVDDLAVIGDFAGRIGLAVDNARLYRAAQEALDEKERSLALLDTLFSTSPVPLAFLDHELRFVRVNRAFVDVDRDLFAHPDGKHLQEVLSGLGEPEMARFRHVLDTGEPLVDLEVAMELPAGSGHHRHFASSYYRVMAEGGEVQGLGIVALEVTDRRRSADVRELLLKQLETERARLEAVVRQMPAGVMIADYPSGRLVVGNRQIERIAGHAFPEGTDVRTWRPDRALTIEGRPLPDQETPLGEAFRTGETVAETELLYRRDDGSLVVLGVSAAPIRDADGNIESGVMTAHDLTRLTAETRTVDALHRVGATLAGELEVDRVVRAVVDAATELTGAQSGAFAPMVVDVQPATAGVHPEDLRVRSFLFVPVTSPSGALLGGLFLGHADADVFDERDQRLVGGIAAQAAVAIENARLYESAQDARRAAERTAAQLARLQAVTARLSQAQTVAEVADVAVREGAAGVDSTTVALCLLDEQGEYLELVREVGYAPDALDEWRRFPLFDSLPAVDAFRTGEPVLLGSLAERDERYPSLRGRPASNSSFATIPLVAEGRAFGAITFSWKEDRAFTGDDQRFMVALGNQCAQALERARLAEAERLAAARQAFLAEASRVLSSSLDYEDILDQLARLIVPELADSAAIHLVDDEGLRLVVAVHADPARERLMLALASREGSVTRSPQLVDVAATGRSRVNADIPDEIWHSIADDPAHLAQLRSLGARSGMAVALRVRGRTLGVLSLTFGPSGRRYGEGDVAVIEDLAGRAAVAIDNARVHNAQREVARTLQESLLPPHLLTVPGLEVAARYRPVDDGSRVGGDFFDVFPAGVRRWGVMMGDVCGQGVPAASLTAMARWTTRVAAMQELLPSAVLRVVNQTVLDADTDERFCTIALAMVEPRADRVKVTLSSGGHPPALLLTAAGEVQALGRHGTALGLFPDPELDDDEFLLYPGDALVLYTDGFIETRSPQGTFDPELLTDVLRRSRGLSAEQIVDEIEKAAVAFEGGHTRDDMAVLAVRVPVAATSTGAANPPISASTSGVATAIAAGSATSAAASPSAAVSPSASPLPSATTSTSASASASPSAATSVSSSADPDATFDQTFPATPASVAIARRELAAWLYRHLTGTELAVWELVLATSELSTNAARAARAGYRVRAWMETGAVVLEVVDDGSGFDGQLPNPDDTVPLDAERGRGLSLVRSLTDECTVRSTTAGTVVRVKKLV
ncbi:MAG: hypothetical protein QOG64_2789, partial [Acidimicrobiaceae bacterium]|nr:hypothetical protein [Acidimicrobiaceae bacterium]